MKAALEIGERLASCAPIWAGDVADIIERALAEARLEEALWWEHLAGDCHGTELASECLYCERILMLRRAVEVGERAVEGK